MHARHRRTSTAVALAAAGTALLLTGCNAKTVTSAAGTGTTSATASPSGSASSAASSSASAPATASASASAKATPVPVVNGTGDNALTISNGTDQVVMNGTVVDFGTVVRDLAWNPGGTKAVFVDGSGNLDVSNPDGSDRVTIAVNPGGQVWSHPTWVVTPTKPLGYYNPAGQTIYFADSVNGASRVAYVSATGVDGKPATIPLITGFGPGSPVVPKAGYAWPSGKGEYTAFANSGSGDIYIQDSYLRTMVSTLTQGSEPAVSPGGDEVVFVRSVAGVDHVFEQAIGRKATTTAVDLTPGFPQDATEPTWSPDGHTVAFRTPAGTDTVAIGGGAPVQVSTYTGLPAYRG